jgi:glycerol-3-phosphate dehydrogenase (NAD(P)+)
MRVIVVGGGAWGTAFAGLALEGGHDVSLAVRDAARPYAPGLAVDPIAEAPYDQADLIVIAVTSRAFREVVEALPGNAPLLSLTKGLDPVSGERLSMLVHGRPVAVLSGPNMADEVAAGLPAVAVVASADGDLALELQEAFNSGLFRVYVNDDIVGVELCAAAKNVIALAAGGVDGLELGDNVKAALITRGLVEMARLGEVCGAQPETFSGLAGMGDLIVTCWHPAGRNRRAGELIARGATPDEAQARIGQVVEGLATAPVLHALARRLGVDLPITEGVCAVLGGTPLASLAGELMGRRPTEE